MRNRVSKFLAFILILVLAIIQSPATSIAQAPDQSNVAEPAASPEPTAPAPPEASSPKANATDGAPIGSVLESLEKELGLVVTPGSSYSKRLSNLELKIYSEVKSGSLVDRVERLQSDFEEKRKNTSQLDKQTSTPPNPVTKTNAANLTEAKGGDKKIQEYLGSLPLENAQLPMFYRIEEAGSKEQSDYLKEILDATKQRVMRFKGMPIPVYITPFQNKNYTRACVEGFENWEGRTTGLVRFVQVDDPKQARIKVVWNRLGMSTDADNCALGAHTVTKWTKKAGGKVAVVSMGAIPLPVYIPRLGPKYTVPAQVIEVNLDLIDAKAYEFRYVLLKNIVTHELGHALGLLGHSETKSDIMFSVTDENSRISQRDINTLSKLYGLKIDIPL